MRAYIELDPECPMVREFRSQEGDRMNTAYGAQGMVADIFVRNHFQTCRRCREYNEQICVKRKREPK